MGRYCWRHLLREDAGTRPQRKTPLILSRGSSRKNWCHWMGYGPWCCQFSFRPTRSVGVWVPPRINVCNAGPWTYIAWVNDGRFSLWQSMRKDRFVFAKVYSMYRVATLNSRFLSNKQQHMAGSNLCCFKFSRDVTSSTVCYCRTSGANAVRLRIALSWSHFPRLVGFPSLLHPSSWWMTELESVDV